MSSDLGASHQSSPRTDAVLNYTDLIGTPFEYGGRGPDRYDCYGLVMELGRRQGVAFPEIESSAELAVCHARMTVEAMSGQWRQVPVPTPGAVAWIQVGRYGSHVAYILDQNRMIHTWEKSHGVVVERIEDWKRRVLGYFIYEQK